MSQADIQVRFQSPQTSIYLNPKVRLAEVTLVSCNMLNFEAVFK